MYSLFAPYQVIIGDCRDVLPTLPYAECIFADPPDGIGKQYVGYSDRPKRDGYLLWLQEVLALLSSRAGITWVSLNPKWIFAAGGVIHNLTSTNTSLSARLCVQTYTFGQHNSRDFGNGYRPLVRIRRKDADVYPNTVRIQSERQRLGDKRADPRGRVPSDVFDFPRVTGNSSQRRSWCPTQLHEGLVERCILSSTLPDDLVVDPFGGTGTVMRVCKKLGRNCITIEISEHVARHIASDNSAVLSGLYIADSNIPLGSIPYDENCPYCRKSASREIT
jgi:adenine-specific DNA-methyltransferase